MVVSHLRTTVRTRVAGLLAAAVAGVALTAVEPAPQAARADACDGTSGVTVVIDFTAFGGDVEVACAPGDPDTGLAAIQDAGFAVEGTLRWGLAFVCRLGGLPTPDVEPCIDTPQASGYWSYWHAPRGGDWEYSDKGVLNYDPAPGSVEGWSYGASEPPSIPAP